MSTARPHRRADLALLRLALTERGPTQLNIPRDSLLRRDRREHPASRSRIERAAGGAQSLDEAAKLLAEAKFPVILSGGGVIMSDGQAEAVALAEYLDAPVVTSYLHNDTFPAEPSALVCGPLGYQGSKAAMKLIAQADVVLALGTRLGPFGTLPQHGIDYWPKNAKLIQVDADHRDARPGEADDGRRLRRCQSGGRGDAARAAAGN